MIVVVGESLVDLTPGADGRVVESVGGSPLNVAVALAGLDAATLLITEFGSDDRAAMIRRYLHDHEVDFLGGPNPGGRTPTATVLVEDRAVPEHQVSYELDLSWHLRHTSLPECDALHVGSLATVLEPGRDTVLDLVEQAWALDVFLSYDPNVRLGGPSSRQTDHDHDQAWGDVESLADRANLVKLSEQDIALLHPGADPDDIARSLLTGERTELVILTRGSRGATGYVDGLRVDVPAVPTRVVDTVGAGDAFMAGVLATLLEDGAFGNYAGGLPQDQRSLERLLHAAADVAALSCSRAGAAPPLRAELRPGWPGSG